MNVVEFSNVHRSFTRGVPVLDGVDFTVGKGEVVGLLGRNGAGKTTLIQLAMGMLFPQTGSVRVFGLDPSHEPVEVKKRVGYVSEDQILPRFLRVEEVLELHRQLFPTWDHAMEIDVIDRFAIPTRARIKTLSKGQARHVALLCATCHRPELLLLDEPAGGLDPVARREFLETAIQMLHDTGTTILFSSHYMGDVERLARQIVMLHDGRVLIDSEIDDLYEAVTVALIPRDAGITKETVLAHPRCLGARDRTENLHAVFAMNPQATSEVIREDFSIATARCRTASLEEIFIEVAGGER
ncbi:MAG: ABC transporter ATP-binding protein [Acidobacteria bacterium]|nr:MAG: ABC transporter ATP-binding protein [Acidobacteriota bacterium]